MIDKIVKKAVTWAAFLLGYYDAKVFVSRRSDISLG